MDPSALCLLVFNFVGSMYGAGLEGLGLKPVCALGGATGQGGHLCMLFRFCPEPVFAVVRRTDKCFHTWSPEVKGSSEVVGYFNLGHPTCVEKASVLGAQAASIARVPDLPKPPTVKI